MLKIRLKRIGKRKEPHYRIVVSQSSKPRDSKSIAELGYYNTLTNPATLEIDKEATKKWLNNGAQPSGTIEQILVKEGIIKSIKRGSKLPKPKAKKKAEESTQAQ